MSDFNILLGHGRNRIVLGDGVQQRTVFVEDLIQRPSTCCISVNFNMKFAHLADGQEEGALESFILGQQLVELLEFSVLEAIGQCAFILGQRL